MIKELEIQGFQSHEKSRLEFVSGVNTIVGDTDSGKSAIIRALNWALTNRPLGTEFVTHGSKDCSVTINTDRGQLIRCRKPFNGYIINDQKFKDIGPSVPQEIGSVIRVADVNIQLQLFPHFLIIQPPGQISRYISELLGLHVIDVAITDAKSEQQRVGKNIIQIQEEVDQATLELVFLDSLDETGEMITRAEIINEEIDKCSVAYEDLIKLSDNINECSQDVSLLNRCLQSIDLSEARGFIESFDKVSGVRDTLFLIKNKISTLIIEITKLSSVSDINVGSVKEIVNSLELCSTNRTALTVLCNSVVNSKSEVDAYRKDLGTYRAKAELAKQIYLTELKRLGVCPYCFTELTEDHLHEVMSRL